MRVEAFDFALPKERIADRPATPRDAARLLEVGRDGLIDRTVRDLPALLRPGDLLVVNDTRVIPARLVGERGTARIEVTLDRPIEAGVWEALARPARKLAPGDRVVFADDLVARVRTREGGRVRLDFGLDEAAMMAALARHGRVPLPPYIARPPDNGDARDYQTVYARHPGAVAAPTAGLHFTPALLSALAARGVGRVDVTLHVGPGTFLPVKVADTRDHRMWPERGTLGTEAAQAIGRVRAERGRIVAVGTTALRLIETAADDAGGIRPFSGETDLFITPGYRFKAADLLLTNFHLPRSTLFMLVSAFAGLERMKRAYAHAIAAGYRFYSYGDACLLERAGE